MQHRRAAVAAALLTAFAAACAPPGLAHLTPGTGSFTSDLATGHLYRWSGDTDRDSNGVSGTYVAGSGDLFVASSLFPVRVGSTDLFPEGHAVTGSAFCDLEVLSDGDEATTGDNDQDEAAVDDDGSTGGSRADGEWDDGGLNGACHTDVYASPSYNTPGCSGYSHASDAVLVGDVWIGAGCDSFTVVDFSPVACVANALLGGDAPGAVDCVTLFANCTTGPHCDPAQVMGCGADGTTDDLGFGEGHGPGGAGVAYPGPAFGCPQGTSTSVTFVFARAEANVDPTTYPPAVSVAASHPTTGWIDWTPNESS